MLQVLRPTYTLRVTVRDRVCGGVFDPLGAKTGCDEVLARAQAALNKEFTDTMSADVFFERFEHQ